MNQLSINSNEFCGCVLVPAFQEEVHIAEVVTGIRKYCDHVIVVDDGSTDNTSKNAEKAGALVIKHDVNKGKGASLNTGFLHVLKNNYDFVITMDADGQHDPEDIPRFIKTFADTDASLIIGNRMYNTEKMPFIRKLTNIVMSRLLSKKINQYVVDTQSGFRLYKSTVLHSIKTVSNRYAAESEIILQMAEYGSKIISVPIKVIYGDEKSKINPFTDTIRFLTMLRKYSGKKKI